MATVLEARIHHKVDDEEAWQSNDPVLINGEMIVSIQSCGLRKIKVGDGESRYSELPYLMDEIMSPTVFVRGMIMLWSGAEDDVPTGWALCDGSNSTPDLRDRFVIGAGSSYMPGNTGGEAEHTLTASEMPAHTHTATVASNGAHTHQVGTDKDAYYSSSGQCWSVHNATSGAAYMNGATSSSGNHSHTATIGETGSGAAHNNLPPYYALCYIMKT